MLVRQLVFGAEFNAGRIPKPRKLSPRTPAWSVRELREALSLTKQPGRMVGINRLPSISSSSQKPLTKG